MSNSSYGQAIETSETFLESRRIDIEKMGDDVAMHHQAVQLQIAATRYRYGYQQIWCGVPIIRLPDDIVLIQEIIWETRPSCIVETGIARGGSLLLNASLMEMCGIPPAVLGIDIQIMPHATRALAQSRFSNVIKLLESDSTSVAAQTEVRNFITTHSGDGPVLAVLDSSHAHSHVLNELQMIAPLLTLGSVIVVADTIVEEMPDDFYVGRPWSRGNSPWTAVNEFLSNNPQFSRVEKWSRRGLISEMREGIVRKTS